ncbi:BON domain-containing protein [Rhizobium sp. NFR07]|uniref:BON domain-containing protein n=1 Tax=Rhizobium sp. NFR07 TaxID=1566262 RepID=UPI0008E6F07E|nr:BON domain-containing protein [Rhizobium sp. NFR07]SFB37245.1 BON domain-containing protein [Rhizobium sp. NFR07]
MPLKKGIDDVSREEDFRDFDDRNIDEGWPYADQPGAASGPVDNAAYGNSGANTEKDRNPGFLLDDAGADGLEEPLKDSLRPGTMGLEDSDDLEERITDTIDGLGIIDMDLIDVHVDRGIVTVEGEVDDAPTAHQILRQVQAVKGVRKVVNHLRLVGVDGSIPDDD